MDYQLYGGSDILLNDNSNSKGSWRLPSDCSMDNDDQYFGWAALKIDEEKPAAGEEQAKGGGGRKRRLSSEGGGGGGGDERRRRQAARAAAPPKDPLYIDGLDGKQKKAAVGGGKGTPKMPHWQVDSYGDLNNEIDSSLSLGTELANNSYNVNDAILNINGLTVFKQEAPSPTSHEMTQLQARQAGGGQQRPSPTPTAGSAGVVQPAAPSAPVGAVQHQVAAAASTLDDASAQTAFNNTINQLLSQTGLAGLHGVMDNNNIPTSPNSQDNYAVSSTNYGFIEDSRFQYVLAAATSIATKQNEDTLTYLNQGQSYEIKLKKLGDLSLYRGKLLKTVVRICFHERRLQYMEKEQMLSWHKSRPGDRILELDVPLSYGAFDIIQPTNSLNVVHFSWDPTKEVGVYIKVNCISTEFTPKKHGGEKGVPFRIQVETYQNGDCVDTSKRLHAAACQIKVFKLKGADRKHKQDREKIMKRPLSEQEKYQPSYDCTVLSDIPNDAVLNSTPIEPLSPSEVIESSSQKNQQGPRIFDTSPVIPQSRQPVVLPEKKDNISDVCDSDHLTQHSNPEDTVAWLTANRFDRHLQTFASFSGADMLRMSREDLIQICGNADGIRLHNALHLKAIAPRLKIYVCRESSSVFNAIFLSAHSNMELIRKLASLTGTTMDQIRDIYLEGPQGIHVQLSNDLLAHVKEETMFSLEILQENDSYIFLLRRTS